MKKTLVALSLALAITIPQGARADGSHNELLGMLGGAALGGFVGSQFGSGTGRLAATGAGVFVGALVGGQLGRSLNDTDRRTMGHSQYQALEYTPSHNSVAWQNPDTGNYGATTPAPAYQNQTGQYCREFTQTVTVGGQTQQAYGTACRQPDGSWVIVGQ